MPPADDRASILETESQRQAAVVAVNLDALDDLFAEDLIHIHSTGLVHTKSELLEHMDRKRGFLAIERGVLHIRVDGDIAVMTGTIVNRMRAKQSGGEVVMDGFVTQVLRRYPDRWRFTNFQFTLSMEP